MSTGQPLSTNSLTVSIFENDFSSASSRVIPRCETRLRKIVPDESLSATDSKKTAVMVGLKSPQKKSSRLFWRRFFASLRQWKGDFKSRWTCHANWGGSDQVKILLHRFDTLLFAGVIRLKYVSYHDKLPSTQVWAEAVLGVKLCSILLYLL